MGTLVRRRGVVRSAAAVLVALVMPVGPAQAAPSCPNGMVCFWAEEGFQGDRIVILDPLPGMCLPLPGAVASAVNATASSTVRVYAGSNCGAQIAAFERGEVPVIAPAAGSYVIP